MPSLLTLTNFWIYKGILKIVYWLIEPTQLNSVFSFRWNELVMPTSRMTRFINSFITVNAIHVRLCQFIRQYLSVLFSNKIADKKKSVLEPFLVTVILCSTFYTIREQNTLKTRNKVLCWILGTVITKQKSHTWSSFERKLDLSAENQAFYFSTRHVVSSSSSKHPSSVTA